MGSLDAQVTKDPSQGTAGISFVSVGVVCSSDEIQGDAGGAAEILLGQNNADILLGTNATNAEVFGENNADILLGTNATNTDVFGAAQQTVSLGPCSNVVAGDGVISRVGLALGSLDAQVTKDPSQGTACISFVSVGVVCSLDEIQGDAGGAAEILLGQNNADIFLGTNATNAEGFGAAQQTVSLGPCSNVNDHIHSQSSSPLKNPLGSLEEESVCSPVPIQKARQYFKKRPRKLCRQLYRGGRTDRKISSVDHANYLATRNTDNPPSTVASHIANRGHSPTKEEVKKTNQRLLEENLRLKKDFHKANHRLKTLLADKRDLLRRLRLESKTSNNLIESIQAEANDTINRARDILAEANRTKIQTELLKDEIDMSQNVLLRERNDLRTQSARLKKQVARMTETHKRRKTALADQRKEMERDVNTEKQRWNISIRLAEKKMLSSLKQLQAERVMWQVLSQEVEVRCKDAELKVHRQKSNSRTLVQMQVDKAIRKERELKSYMLELHEIHAVQLQKERKAKRVAIQSSKHW